MVAAFGEAKVKDARFTDGTRVARQTYDSSNLHDSVAITNFVHKLGDRNKMKLLKNSRVSVLLTWEYVDLFVGFCWAEDDDIPKPTSGVHF
jgi:hypothetical protein